MAGASVGGHHVDVDELPSVATVTEVALLLRLSKTAVYDAVRRGELPALRLGRRILFPKETLIAFLRRPLARAARGRGKESTC
jgi:excisionase family DNA binding protein